MEQWKTVPGFEGLYSVSDQGRVQSSGRFCGARNGGSAYRKGRILKPVLKKDSNYLCVSLTREGRKYQMMLHGIVLLAFVGPCPLGHECCHGKEGRFCNHLSNLRYCTRRENNDDRYTQDGIARGTRHGMAKLSESSVLAIRDSDDTHVALATVHGITPTQVWVHTSAANLETYLMFEPLEYFDAYDAPDDAASGEIRCKLCGAFPLEWSEVRVHPSNSKAWRLIDAQGNFHACPKMGAVASADDFDDLTETSK